MTITRLRSRTDLLSACDDAFARLDPAEELTGWALGRAVAVMRASAARSPSLFVWGTGVGALLDALLDVGAFESHAIAGVSVPLTELDETTRRFTVVGGGDWHWMWTGRRSGLRAHPLRLVELDDTADAEEITDLGRENPRFEGFPGTGHNETWLGARDTTGRLVACGAIQRLPAGTAHLGGILVARTHRRQGLGTAISAALTDRVVAAEGVCTLGVYADNADARRLYGRLGYVTDKAWASRTIAPIAGQAGVEVLVADGPPTSPADGRTGRSQRPRRA